MKFTPWVWRAAPACVEYYRCGLLWMTNVDVAIVPHCGPLRNEVPKRELTTHIISIDCGIICLNARAKADVVYKW